MASNWALSSVIEPVNGFLFPVFRDWPWFLFDCPQKNVLACFWLSYTGFSISFLRTTFAPFPYMKYVFDAVTYRKYVLVRLQGVGASLNRETVSWKQCVFPVLPGQQSFWTLKAENHDLYKNGLLKLPRGPSITEVKSALLVRLLLSFSFSRVQASSFIAPTIYFALFTTTLGFLELYITKKKRS